jgi:hypothetical protein
MTQATKAVIAPEKVEQKNVTTLKVVTNEKIQSAMDRIKRAEQFDILTKRYQHLVDKKEELDKFLLADDGLQGITLFLEGGNKSFEVSNTSVIKELLTTATTKLTSLLASSEKEILEFSI